MKVDVFFYWAIEEEDDKFPSWEGYKFKVFKSGSLTLAEKASMVERYQRAYWAEDKEVLDGRED